MASFELIMPKMGESIMEATILKWLKKEGDSIEMDESILEIATDKVDSDVPSPQSGKLSKIMFKEGEVVPVGKVIALIETGTSSAVVSVPAQETGSRTPEASPMPPPTSLSSTTPAAIHSSMHRFYSPLVKNMAREEGISQEELDRISGSGAEGRVTKKDMLAYLSTRSSAPPVKEVQKEAEPSSPATAVNFSPPAVSITGEVEIVEMDRMRRLIADHMVMSKHVAPHVTSFVEADVTNLVLWREKNKDKFLSRQGEKITFTPIFIEAIVKALRDFPGVNASVDGTRIILKKYFNIGIAAALPSGNLIVPVVKGADRMNLVGLTKEVNRLVEAARSNKLVPSEIQDGTFTLTNVGTFGNLSGTPIINQPQVAILSTGSIKKKPAVLETEYGDVIAIRHLVFLSLSYDHRVVDGYLGGSFLRRVADYLEQWDPNRDF